MSHDYSNITNSRGYRMDATSAGLIAMKLDQADNNADEQISSSIWNSFASEHGLETIEEGEQMGIKKAWVLITKALVRASNGVVAECNRLAGEWLQRAPEADGEVQNTSSEEAVEEGGSADSSRGTQGAQGNQAAQGSQGAQGSSDRQTQEEKDAASIKVTVPTCMSKRGQDIKGYQKSGKALRESLAQGSTDGITPENVAYTMKTVNFNENTKEQAKTVFNNIVKRMQDLGIFEQGKDYASWNSVCRDMKTWDKINNLLCEYASRIVRIENEVIENDNYRIKNHTKIQQSFDEANALLAKVANMDPKPAISSGTYDGQDWKEINLEDGRWIKVFYDSNGEIAEIFISSDTTLDTESNGSQFDGDEVHYTKEKAQYSIDHSSGIYGGYISSGYDFEKIKALVERIFEEA